jgi:hypothetical protein
MYSKIAGTIGALGNLEIRAITLGKICVYECLSWSLMKNIVKRNILVSNHDEHVEDNIKSINEFNANSYLGGVEPIFGDWIQQLFKGNLLTTFFVPCFFSSTCKSDSCHFQQ